MYYYTEIYLQNSAMVTFDFWRNGRPMHHIDGMIDCENTGHATSD